MVLAPVVDTVDVIIMFLFAASFLLVAILFIPIIILLEATLLRRLVPGTSAIRNAIVLNISTSVLGALLGLIFAELFSDFTNSLEDGTTLLVLFLLTLALTIPVEAGILKILESKISFSHSMRASTIINIASYATFGLAVGLINWGYDAAYMRRDGGFLLYVVPIACVIALVVLIIENFLSIVSPTIPKVMKQEPSTREHFVDQLEVEAQSSESNMELEELAILTTPDVSPEHPSDPGKQRQGLMKNLISWVLVTTVGTTSAFGLSALVIYKLTSMGGIIWSILLLGTIIGGMQWLLLRKHVHKAGWWVFATLGGWAVTLLLVVRAIVLLEFASYEVILDENYPVIALATLVAGLILGISTGVFQWLVIRKLHDKSYFWILFSSLGWIVGLFSGTVVGLSIYYVLQQYNTLFGSRLDIDPNTFIRWPVILAGIATGLTAGAITGTAYAWWIQLSRVNEPLQRMESTPEPD